MTSTEERASSGLTSPSRIATIAPADLGLKIITTEPPDISVDVVAVHGLGAIPSKTWVEKKPKVNWIESEGMLPTDLPKARVMTFGYDSLWAGVDPIRTDVRDIVENFLKTRIAEREDCLECPLIFLAHCFGGLVVQRMLLRANQRPETRHICEVTTGVIFQGTPHRGTGAFSNTGMIYPAIASNPDMHMEQGVLDIFKSDDADLIPNTRELRAIVREVKILYNAATAKSTNRGRSPQPEPTRLQLACRNCQTDGVEHLLEKGERIEAVDAECKTALHWAAKSGSDEIVYLLLRKEAKKTARDDLGQKPASYTIKDSAAHWLLKNGSESNDTDRNRDNFLQWAIKKHTIDTVEWLRSRDCEINGEDADGFTPLANAVSRDFRDVVKLLVDHKANMCAKDMNCCPLLVLAARGGHYASAKLLIDQKVALEDTEPNTGRTALFVAVREQKIDVVRILLSRGANAKTHDNNGWTPLAIISFKGKIDIMQLLVDAVADVNNSGNPTNHRPLPEACWWRANYAAEWLLDRGADINQRVPEGTVLESYRHDANAAETWGGHFAEK